MSQLREEREVRKLNGEDFGVAMKRKDLQAWLGGIQFYPRPRKVRVEPHIHLCATNSSNPRLFDQIGEGTFKPTGTQFAIIEFLDAGRSRVWGLVPMRNIREPQWVH